MSHTPFFSIIIPTYNRAEVISKTIDTVLSQTFNDYELIIIDDGSVDHTREIIESYADERIKYVYQNNAERSVARNNGVKQSRASWICFLDSDDKYGEDHLANLYNYIIKNSIDEGLLFTGYQIENNEGISIPDSQEMNDNPADYFFRYPVNPTRVCISRKILTDIKFRTDCIIVEDMICWLEICKVFPVYQVKGNSVSYVFHDNNSVNISNNSHRKMLKGLMTVIKQVPNLLEHISPQIKKSVFADIYFGISKSEVLKENRLEAIYYLGVSIIKDFRSKKLKHRIFILLLLFCSSIDRVKRDML